MLHPSYKILTVFVGCFFKSGDITKVENPISRSVEAPKIGRLPTKSGDLTGMHSDCHSSIQRQCGTSTIAGTNVGIGWNRRKTYLCVSCEIFISSIAE